MQGHKTIVIPGDPVAAKRPRFSRKLGRAYDVQHSVRDCMTWHIAKQWGEMAPLDGAVRVDITFYMKLPASMSKKRRKALEGQPCLKHWDVSNGVKILEDACNGVVFADDSQITTLLASKEWSEDPKTIINISETN